MVPELTCWDDWVVWVNVAEAPAPIRASAARPTTPRVANFRNMVFLLSLGCAMGTRADGSGDGLGSTGAHPLSDVEEDEQGHAEPGHDEADAAQLGQPAEVGNDEDEPVAG